MKCRFRQTLLIENGDIIKILPGDKPQIIDKAPSGKVYLDGNLNVETDSNLLKIEKIYQLMDI